MQNLWSPWRSQYIKGVEDTSNGCFFCNGIQKNGEFDSDSLIVYRNERCFVILNRFPYNSGHIMVVPKIHSGDLLSIEQETMNEIMATIQLSVKALTKVYNPHAFNIGANIGKVAGAGVPDHIHFHIVPRWNGDVNFMPVLADIKVASESLEDTWHQLHAAFLELTGISKAK